LRRRNTALGVFEGMYDGGKPYQKRIWLGGFFQIRIRRSLEQKTNFDALSTKHVSKEQKQKETKSSIGLWRGFRRAKERSHLRGGNGNFS